MKAISQRAGIWALIMATAVTATGQMVRENNTTLRFPVNGGPSGQYELGEALPGISFDRPVCVATPPGETNRLFVVERVGRVMAIHNLASPTKELFLDLTAKVSASDWQQDRRTEGLSSIAFHPDFANNRRFFVSYNTITSTAAGSGHHNRVSEFKASADLRQGLVETEIPLITQYDEGDGHNINDLHFGADGYLYIATGDEGDGGSGDDFNNAQKIDKDFFSGILRIDVDRRSGNLTPNEHPASNRQAYKIPADNPYVGASSFNGQAVNPSNVRTEFYAVGLRNTWRFSFDPLNQNIYAGDVGQHGREEVNWITKGGNYGWPYREGTLNGVKTGPGGFVSAAPIFEYGTGFGVDQGFSVTGGVVYRGDRTPGLNGHFVFADYVSGNLWAMNVDAQPPGRPARLLGQVGIAGFGHDPRNGDVLAVNHDGGKILRLQFSTGVPGDVPTTLDQTGIFANLATLQPHRGIYGYDVNTPLWSDDAQKIRWFSIPAGQKVRFHPETNWTFPTGSVWIKHFEIRLNPNEAPTRLETRALVKTDSGVYGVTYRWSNDGTTATLVPEGGDTRGLLVNTGTTSRRQTWRFPSRAECLGCHTPAGGRVLGFNTAQLNRAFGYGGETTNQIAALAGAGFFENPPAHPHGLRALSPLGDSSASRAWRVRSYLAANCAPCHQPAGNIFAIWDGRATTPISQASIIYGHLLNGSGENKVAYPGATNRTAILTRMRSLGTDRMPPLGTSVLDTEAIRLISEWVTEDLPAFESYGGYAARHFGNPAPLPEEDADRDGISNFAEYLMNSNPAQRTERLSMFSWLGEGQGAITFRQPANRAIVVETADQPGSGGWRLLDHPANLFRFPAGALDRTIPVPIEGGNRFHRLRVIEP